MISIQNRHCHLAASILLPGPTLPKLSTNIDRQIDLFSKITCHFPGLFFLQKFYRRFLVIPCFHIAKGDIWAPLVSSRGRSHTIPFIWWHHTIPHPFANRCWWKMTSAWGSHLGFIRSCQNPIGRARPRNWIFWLSHIKQRSWKELIEFYVAGIEIGDNPIWGMTREVPKCVSLL